MRARGFTLTELLVVVAIIAVLAGITTSAFVAARNGAKVTADISNMRQLGAAAALYQSDFDNVFPLSASTLVASGRVPSAIVSSSRDATPDGLAVAIANEVLPPVGRAMPKLPYRLSYPGLFEMGFDQTFVQNHLTSASGVGWLVEVSACEPRAGTLAGSVGRYHRLMLDGSVQKRVQSVFAFNDDGQSGRATHPLMFFIDEDAAWLTDRKL
jgi:prepilin-type N-terminal cleavage/methylation domain-containing protein